MSGIGTAMEYRQLGASGLKVSALGFGAGTFGGKGPLFSAWGNTGVEHARRIVDISLDAGVTFFDPADVYSDASSESILGAAIRCRLDRVFVSTKHSPRLCYGTTDFDSSPLHLLAQPDALFVPYLS